MSMTSPSRHIHRAAGERKKRLLLIARYYATREKRLYPWRGEYSDIYQDAAYGALRSLITYDPEGEMEEFTWMHLYARSYVRRARTKMVNTFRGFAQKVPI
jgi:DNA-directed RNA polymerase specialized sigma24 family protein